MRDGLILKRRLSLAGHKPSINPDTQDAMLLKPIFVDKNRRHGTRHDVFFLRM